MTRKRAKTIPAASLTLPGMAIAAGEAKFGLQTPQTIVAHQIYDLHAIILWICILIGVVVFGFMFYAIVRHRRSVGHRAKQFRENMLVQIMWTVIPVLIVVGLLLVGGLYFVGMLMFDRQSLANELDGIPVVPVRT